MFVHCSPDLVDRSSGYCEDGSSNTRSRDEVATSCWEKQALSDDGQGGLVHLTPVAAAPAGPTRIGCVEPFMAQLPDWKGPNVVHGPAPGQPSVVAVHVTPPLEVISTGKRPPSDSGTCPLL